MSSKILLTNENNTPEEELKILKECIEKCKKCDCVARITQMVKTNANDYRQLDIEQFVFSAQTTVHINDGLVYVQLMTNDNSNFQHVRQMHSIVRKRGTDKYLAGELNDYFLVIDLLKEEEELSLFYEFSLFQPQFFTLEHDTLEIALPIDRMHFFKEQLDRDEIDYELMEQEGVYGTAEDDSTGYAGDGETYLTGESYL